MYLLSVLIIISQKWLVVLKCINIVFKVFTYTSESIIFLFTQFNLWAFTSYFKFKHNTMGHFV